MFNTATLSLVAIVLQHRTNILTSSLHVRHDWPVLKYIYCVPHASPFGQSWPCDEKSTTNSDQHSTAQHSRSRFFLCCTSSRSLHQRRHQTGCRRAETSLVWLVRRSILLLDSSDLNLNASCD